MKLNRLFVILFVLLAGVGAVSAQDMIGTPVTSITTVSAAGEAASLTEVPGNSVFEGSTFTVNFLGLTRMLTAFEVDGMMVDVSMGAPATVTLRRNPATDTRVVAWYQGAVNTGSSTIIAATEGPLSEPELINGNNILNGLDNVFVNEGASAGDVLFQGNSSVERIDYVLASPVMASDAAAFVVFERGPFDGHDGFGIAAITGVDADGNPTSFGSLFQIPAGWSPIILENVPPYLVMSNGAEGELALPISLTLLSGSQQMGGIVFRTTELVDAGTEVYGYALVGPDVTCTAEELVDVANACFPTNTVNPGGLDLPNINVGVVTLQ